jgi:diguanylate cyclase (GGDEF)-like protein
VGRWGGEEFLILCRNEDSTGATAFAEKLRAAIEEESFIPQRQITASFGVAACRDEDVARSLIARADARLYAAKAAGRNRVFS